MKIKIQYKNFCSETKSFLLDQAFAKNLIWFLDYFSYLLFYSDLIPMFPSLILDLQYLLRFSDFQFATSNSYSISIETSIHFHNWTLLSCPKRISQTIIFDVILVNLSIWILYYILPITKIFKHCNRTYIYVGLSAFTTSPSQAISTFILCLDTRCLTLTFIFTNFHPGSTLLFWFFG